MGRSGRPIPSDARVWVGNSHTTWAISISGKSRDSYPLVLSSILRWLSMARWTSGSSRHPLKVKITSSNLVRATNHTRAPG